MDQVYILIESDYDGSVILGVYKTKKQAQEAEDEKYRMKKEIYSGLGWHWELWDVQERV